MLRKQLRRSQEEAAVSHQKVRELQGQIRKSSEQNRKLNKLVRTKNLMEREMLTVQLDHTRESLGEMTRKVAVSRQLFIVIHISTFHTVMCIHMYIMARG